MHLFLFVLFVYLGAIPHNDQGLLPTFYLGIIPIGACGTIWGDGYQNRVISLQGKHLTTLLSLQTQCTSWPKEQKWLFVRSVNSLDTYEPLSTFLGF